MEINDVYNSNFYISKSVSVFIAMGGILHGSVDDVVEGYTLTGVLKKPLHNSRFVFREIWNDLNYEKLFAGPKLLKSALNDISILVAAILSAGPHELIHAGTNLLMGGTNKQVVISTLSGGWFYEKLIPGVESTLTGSYVEVGEASLLALMVSKAAPFAIMTPLGLYLLNEGKKRENLPVAIAGSGMVISYVASIEDFMGVTVIATERIYNALSNQNFQDEFMIIPIVVGGLYLGYKTMNLTYRAFKGGVTSLRNYFQSGAVS